MDKCQIVEVSLGKCNLRMCKPVDDISKIAGIQSYKSLYIKNRSWKLPHRIMVVVNAILHAVNWLQVYFKVKAGSVLFWQGPNSYSNFVGRYLLRRLIAKKQIKLVGLFHDIDELRYQNGENQKYAKRTKRQTDFISQNADYIIVHNNSMMKYVESRGVDKSKLVILQIFDYLCEENEKQIKFNNKLIIIAGNLDITKSGYIYQLGRLKSFTFNLYGTNFSRESISSSNVIYHGRVDADTLTSKLTEGFGLVWDGDSIEDCTGGTGVYLRYNNPHKLSLYLASGIPVIIWSGAAEAEFVRKNRVGLCVNSLLELEEQLEKIDEETYRVYQKNVERIRGRLCEGYYTQKALSKIEKALFEESAEFSE